MGPRFPNKQVVSQQPDVVDSTENMTETIDTIEQSIVEESINTKEETAVDTIPEEQVVTDTVDEAHVEPAVVDVVEEVHVEPAVTAEEVVLHTNNDTIQQPNIVVSEEPIVEYVPVYLTRDDIARIIADSSINVMDTLNKIEKDAIPEYKILVSKLIGYAKDMSMTSPSQDAKTSVGRNYDLYSVLKSVINSTDYQTFKVKFDIINLIFKEYAKDAFAAHMLTRYYHEWRWDAESLNTYLNTITVIAELCDVSTRKHKLDKKLISLKLYADKTKYNITETGVNNLIKYYQ